MTVRKLGNFELHELLGEGAMGQVYRAVDVHLDRPVAVKLLSSRLDFDPSFSDRFKREARLAAKLNHPNIATIYAFGEEEGEAYIAMEFVEGVTLEHLLRERSLSFAEIRKFGIQIASALDVAHAMEIVHRDIKPSNLMLTGNGDIKVMDFGVARRGGETQLTMDGALVGTANIMAPEIIKGGGATTASDLFSLGCVLFEAVSGRPAFDGETAMAVLYKVMNEDPPELLSSRGDIPSDMIDLVRGLLVKDPAARFGPAKAVAERLTAVTPPSETLLNRPRAQAETLILSGEAGPGAPGAAREAAATLPPAGSDAPKAPSPIPEVQAVRTNPWTWIGALAAVGAVVTVVVMLMGREGREREHPVEQAVEQNDAGARLLDAWRQGRNDPELLKNAIVSFRKSARTDSTFALPLANMGYAMSSLARSTGDRRWFAEAESVLVLAVKRDSSLALSYAHLADLQWDLGRTGAAVGEYRRALEKQPDEALRQTLWNNLGALLVVRGEPDSALAVLRPAVEAYPGEAYLWKNLAEAYEARGDMDPARDAIIEATTLLPDNATMAGIRTRIESASN